jgi:hypothetical protein
MTFDSQRRRVVLFGGFASTYLGDTWEWDGIAWTQAAIAGPSVRAGHAMVYDSQRGRTVLFGGLDSSAFLGDTWEWNGIAWAQTPHTGPGRRAEHAMAYDSQRGRTVLFGGQRDAAALGDTWEFNGTSWAQLAGGPPLRTNCVMSYDSFRGRTVMFGGCLGQLYYGDTWEWDGATWAQVANMGPPGRCGHAMAYDSQRENTLLFGGYASRYFGDTWRWRGGLVATASTFGAGCGNPALTLTPVSGSPPRIGTTARVAVANVPSNIAFVALGTSRTARGTASLPMSLAQFGLPGCDLLQSADAILPAVMTGPTAADFSSPLPNLGALIGMPVYLQGWAISASADANNWASSIVSNGVHWLLGNN